MTIFGAVTGLLFVLLAQFRHGRAFDPSARVLASAATAAAFLILRWATLQQAKGGT